MKIVKMFFCEGTDKAVMRPYLLNINTYHLLMSRLLTCDVCLKQLLVFSEDIYLVALSAASTEMTWPNVAGRPVDHSKNHHMPSCSVTRTLRWKHLRQRNKGPVSWMSRLYPIPMFAEYLSLCAVHTCFTGSVCTLNSTLCAPMKLWF